MHFGIDRDRFQLAAALERVVRNVIRSIPGNRRKLRTVLKQVAAANLGNGLRNRHFRDLRTASESIAAERRHGSGDRDPGQFRTAVKRIVPDRKQRADPLVRPFKDDRRQSSAILERIGAESLDRCGNRDGRKPRTCKHVRTGTVGNGRRT